MTTEYSFTIRYTWAGGSRSSPVTRRDNRTLKFATREEANGHIAGIELDTSSRYHGCVMEVVENVVPKPFRVQRKVGEKPWKYIMVTGKGARAHQRWSTREEAQAYLDTHYPHGQYDVSVKCRIVG